MEKRLRCKDCKWLIDLRRTKCVSDRWAVITRVNPGQFACKDFRLRYKKEIGEILAGLADEEPAFIANPGQFACKRFVYDGEGSNELENHRPA